MAAAKRRRRVLLEIHLAANDPEDLSNLIAPDGRPPPVAPNDPQIRKTRATEHLPSESCRSILSKQERDRRGDLES
jgi:hypothetical protein